MTTKTSDVALSTNAMFAGIRICPFSPQSLQPGTLPLLTQTSKLSVSEAIEGTPKKVRTLAVNRSETFRVIESPSEEMLEFCETIKAANKLQSLVSEVLSERYADTEQTNLEVEERIYSGIYGNSDKELLEQFQTASWPERVSIIKNFTDERLKQLGKRLIAFTHQNF